MKKFLSKISTVIVTTSLICTPLAVLVEPLTVYAATIDEIKTSGSSWTVPAGVTSVKVWVIGAGGGGGGGNNSGWQSSGAGGAGGVAYKTFTVTPGQSISYSIGTAGAGGVGTNAGTSGGDTTATYNATTITGNGGGGGATCAGGTAGTGGAFSGGDGGATGGAGGSGTCGDTGGPGGGAIGTAAGGNASGTTGLNGAQSVDVSGLQAAITAAGDTWTSFGVGNTDSSSACIGACNGGDATGFGSGGGGPAWYGGNGGAGRLGGGGGGSKGGGGGSLTGGAGGAGAVVFEYNGDRSNGATRVTSVFSMLGGKLKLLGGAFYRGPYLHEFLNPTFSASSNGASYTGLTTTGGMRDGNYTSTNSIHVTQIATNSYIMADLGSSRYITKVILAPTDPATGFNSTYLSGRVLEGSNDNSSYTTIVSSITTIGESTPFTIPVGTSYRYLRVRVPFSNAVAMGDFRIFAIY